MLRGDKIAVHNTESGLKESATFQRYNPDKSKMLVQIDTNLKWVTITDHPVPEFTPQVNEVKKDKPMFAGMPKYKQVLAMYDAGNENIEKLAELTGSKTDYVKRVLKDNR